MNISSFILFVAMIAVILLAAACIVLGVFVYRLVRERDRAIEASNQKSNFIARMSHEMRTPIGAIIGMADIARESDDERRVAYCLDKISDASYYLKGFLSNTLDMASIEAGTFELSESDFLVAEAINRATAILGFDIAEKRQELTVHIGEKVPLAIVGDMQLLTQVITNLLANSHEFTASGGRIAISVEAVAKEGNTYTLRFSVADNGPGISDEHKTILLNEPEKSAAQRYSGASLSLAISQYIVHQMGGKLWAESEPKQGARLMFDIKVAEGQAEEAIITKKARCAADEKALDSAKFPGKRILMVEDMEINREIIGELLADTGVRIDYAANGLEGVQMFAEKPDAYDIIFMDIQMPEMDGYAATAKIRAMNAVEGRNVPIIAMTANVFKEDAQHCLDVGMNAHIAKPVSRSEVLWAMDKFIVM
ncbi:MAG: response regulator [Lachnospiraceae bacterium]|jgi:CheY-like chemotaxis protein|nr:response regulator [Lachnospiraceae bacterium]